MCSKAARVAHGLDRVIAVVVQPGVDFSHDGTFHYDHEKALGLTSAIDAFDGFAFEAHSTDYQSTENLAALVADHSIILKFGPEITFRFREAIMALAHVEKFLDLPNSSRVMEVVAQAMEDDPSNWAKYYSGTAAEVKFLKLFSYSDRIRYYWDKEAVTDALKTLIQNLASCDVRAAFASQYGDEFPIAETGVAPQTPISKRVKTTIERYYRASGWL